jgi:uncharacterized protein YneF (UPF0154 family)
MRVPVGIIVAFLIGFFIAKTSAEPYIRHLIDAIGYDLTHAH